MANDEFGNYTAISPDGNSIFIGAWRDDSQRGSVYRYVWNGSSWVETIFKPHDGNGEDFFGCSIKITPDGNKVLIGAFKSDFSWAMSGSAYLYSWNGSAWLTNRFGAYDGYQNDWMGQGIGISSNGYVVVIGAHMENPIDSGSGSVYHFEWNGSSWSTNKFFPNDGSQFDYFGYRLAVTPDANTILVSAVGDDDKGDYSGSVYLFKKDGAIWITNKFTAPDGAPNDKFGFSLDLTPDGNTFIVGAIGDDDKGAESGSVYRFHWNGLTWETNKVTAYDGEANDNFGYSIAITPDGNTAIIGAYYDNDKGSTSGSVYRYKW
ncbi:MAG: hypothetical protein HPY53_14440 [Brevinematales bacterium]|nr:hypothetical protein [Brevinematales bacterium]